MAYKTNKLAGRIIEKYGTQKAFAEALGMQQSTLSRLLTDGKDWRGSKLIKAIKLLEIPEQEIEAYFFEQRVAENQPCEA